MAVSDHHKSARHVHESHGHMTLTSGTGEESHREEKVFDGGQLVSYITKHTVEKLFLQVNNIT